MATHKRRVPSSKKSAPASRFSKFGNLRNLFSNTRQKIDFKNRYKKTVVFAQKKPFTSFFISLGILFVVILLGSTIFRVKAPEIEERSQPKKVEIYHIGEAAKISLQGEVKKDGVITIVAQTPGIVSSVNVADGASVKKGTVLVSLASNYQGGNAASLQRQLAGLTYSNTKSTFDTQTEIIKKQRETVALQTDNSDKLRDITQVSINDTRDLLNLNTNIINQIKQNITALQNNNASPSDILALQQVLSQVQSGTNQLSSALRANEYSSNETNAPVQIENVNRDIASKQLDIQEKSLKMSLEAAGISLRLAQVQEASMYPAAPFQGTVQKIHVKIGENVNPGTPLVTFTGDSGGVVIDVKAPKEIAEKVSKIDPAEISVDGRKIDAVPSYISTDATDGQLYSIIFTLGDEYKSFFTDKSYVAVNLRTGQMIDGPIPYIPVDSVFQTQDEAYVFVVENGKAKSKKVVLGDVTGGYVVVEKGLKNSDKVILNRTVIEGDPVTF